MINFLNAEFKKLWFPKFSQLYLFLTIILSMIIGLLFSLTTKVTQNRTLAELEPMDVISANLLGVDVATILLIIFVSLTVGREFQKNTIQTYLMVTPGRARYVMGKALTFLILSLIIGIFVAALTLGDGYLILRGANKPLPPLSDTLRFAAGCVSMPIFYALWASCAAFFFRNSAGGIAGSLLVMFLPSLAKLLSSSIQGKVVTLLPASAIHSLTGAVQKGSPEDVGIIVALLILGVWAVLACMLAVWSFRRRDI